MRNEQSAKRSALKGRVFKIPEKSRFVFEQIVSECGIAARGIARTFGGGLGRSTVAHFARKVRGDEYRGGKTTAKNPESPAPPRALDIFDTCSWRQNNG